MRWLADENIPAGVVVWLRDEGHDVVWMVETFRGESDLAVLARARREDRILITLDRDFGELVFLRSAPPPAGIVYVRLVPASVSQLVARLHWLLRSGDVSIPGGFVVLDADGARSRRLP